MKIFTIKLENPNGDETFFTTYADSKTEAIKIAKREYPRHKILDS